MSGLGFENVGCAASHVVCNGITAAPNGAKALHGEKVAFGVICQLVAENAPREQLEEVLDFSREEMMLALEASAQVDSLYRPVSREEGGSAMLMDRIEERENANERVLNHMLLEQLLKILEEEERQLIDLRYFHEKTQMETAKELGISQVQVSRMEKKILRKMRGEI